MKVKLEHAEAVAYQHCGIIDTTLDHGAQDQIKLLAAIAVRGAAQRPDERHEEAALQPGVGLPRAQLRHLLGVGKLVHQALIHAHARLDQVDLAGMGQVVVPLVAHHLQQRRHHALEAVGDVGALSCSQGRRQGGQPGLQQWAPAQHVRLHVDHATAADGGRRRDLQVHGLEQQIHLVRHLDDLTTHQAQLLVVVQHLRCQHCGSAMGAHCYCVQYYRVHVLDPDGIDWAVKNQPLAIRGLRRVRERVNELATGRWVQRRGAEQYMQTVMLRTWAVAKAR